LTERREREVLEQAVRSVAKQARNAYDLIDALGCAGSPLMMNPCSVPRSYGPNSSA
jgi:hypothetical protein